MKREIELWKRVSRDAGLLARAADVNPTDVAEVSSLRRHASAEEVSVALALSAARAKAAVKFGDRGAQLIADVSGVEQASGTAVAAYKARRMRAARGADASVADLCCGIGGDSMAMVDTGLSVLSIDRDPLRAWMTRHNTGDRARSVCADVIDVKHDGHAIHLDPARRNEAAGRRAWRLEDYQPGPDVIGALLDQAPAAALKLSPGVDIQSLPWPGELDFISEQGRLVQAVLWTNGFAEDQRRATLIDGGDVHVISGEPLAPRVRAAQRYLYTFDPAVERAELIGLLCEQLDAPAIHPKLGLLTSDGVINSPWTKGFELIERMPWRPKRVKQWLSAHDGGRVEVKTRDKACDPDQEQQRLRGAGDTLYTVFVLRFHAKVEALITRRF